MCHVSTGKPVPQTNTHCGCSCNCAAMMTVEEEIQLLKDHKKFMPDQIGEIDKKKEALQATKES